MFGVKWSIAPRNPDEPKEKYAKCSRCRHDWHGLPENGCPGSWDSDE